MTNPEWPKDLKWNDSPDPVISPHERAEPLTKEQLWNLRKTVISVADDKGIGGPAQFTCDNCAHAPWCKLVFDLYNTNGDCLADK